MPLSDLRREFRLTPAGRPRALQYRRDQELRETQIVPADLIAD